MKKNVLVFPSGSEIGLEINRSLNYSKDLNVFGASSVKDNGDIHFKKNILGAPFVNEDGFIDWLNGCIERYKIDFVFPAMDSVILKLVENKDKINAKIISHSLEFCKICSLKSKTYLALQPAPYLPKWSFNIEDFKSYPIFKKPDFGYGSRGAGLIESKDEAIYYANNLRNEYIFCEYLNGEEYTVDCFSNSKNMISYFHVRERSKIINGISSRSFSVKHTKEFKRIIEDVALKLKPKGAWFCQLKRNSSGDLKLLEIAARIGGSSSLSRMKGINFSLLNIFQAMGKEISILENKFELTQERSLNIAYSSNIEFEEVYVDYDDCLMINKRINHNLLSLLFKLKEDGKKINLITRHEGNLKTQLEKNFSNSFFHSVIHIKDNSAKSAHIKNINSIFIDDSFKERKDVSTNLNIPVFSPDAIEPLFYI